MLISALVAESFFGTLKNEWFHHERLMDAETTKYLTVEFIESYYYPDRSCIPTSEKAAA
jgi:transposase InsO family protein